MRISDWSSDVCSSDLQFVALRRKVQVFPHAVVAIDGGKLEAVNSRGRNFTGGKVKVRRKQLDESVARYLAERDRADRAVTEKPASIAGFRRVTYCFN